MIICEGCTHSTEPEELLWRGSSISQCDEGLEYDPSCPEFNPRRKGPPNESAFINIFRVGKLHPNYPGIHPDLHEAVKQLGCMGPGDHLGEFCRHFNNELGSGCDKGPSNPNKHQVQLIKNQAKLGYCPIYVKK